MRFLPDARHQSLVWLSFDPGHRLMRQFVCDHGVERAFVLHGPERTLWLNGASARFTKSTRASVWH